MTSLFKAKEPLFKRLMLIEQTRTISHVSYKKFAVHSHVKGQRRMLLNRQKSLTVCLVQRVAGEIEYEDLEKFYLELPMT